MRLIITTLIALLTATGLLPQTAPTAPTAHPLTVMTWNVESGGTDSATIAGQISAFDGVDLWGLTEVNDAIEGTRYATAASDGEGASFSAVQGSTGGGDRLLAIYDENRFDLQGSDELEEVNIGGNVRASLLLTLTETTTGLSFLFMVNHLYRTNDDARHDQAALLNTWAAAQSLPVINVGDFNFDYALDESSRDAGYDLMTAGDTWEWVKPAQLVTTQCSGFPCAFNSVLDFVFVAGSAQAWPATAEIIVRDGDFPDDDTTSDHRPVMATFTLPDQAAARIYLPAVIVPAPAAEDTPTLTPTATSTQQPTTTPTPTATTTAGPTPTPTPTATDQAGAVCPCSSNTLNCSDFDTQPEAQACHDYCEDQGAGDIHRLDGNDDDGLACESLPGGFTLVR